MARNLVADDPIPAAVAPAELTREANRPVLVGGVNAPGAEPACEQGEDSRTRTEIQHDVARPDGPPQRLRIRVRPDLIGHDRAVAPEGVRHPG